ncbi:hypothetical protein [Kluyvera intermedia]|uniref:hypothetical protein n=1 Tax=Kluyvera intermedia TaxID=61648 RepID=UPI00111C373B|nr:hypothetical protein [Kluyvera intermedia]
MADAYLSTVPDWRALLFDRPGSLARAGNVYDVIALPFRDIFMFILERIIHLFTGRIFSEN